VSKIKLVITDVDGTLVTTEKSLRPSAVAAVRKLHDAGIGFTICSSRPPFGLTTMRDALQITLPFGGYNGGSIVEPDLTVIEQVCIPPDIARLAVDTLHANGVSTWVFVGNEWVILDRQGDHVDHETHTIDVGPTVVDRYTDYHFSAVGKIVGASNDHPLIAKVEGIMKEALGHSAHAARSQAYYCDVIAPGIDKGRIVEVLSKRLGIAKDEIAVRCSPPPGFRSRWATRPITSRRRPRVSHPAPTTKMAGPGRSTNTFSARRFYSSNDATHC
jgi:HAD superfamily hydrolase (TIGR01484 family)